jgi:hypothetical protein
MFDPAAFADDKTVGIEPTRSPVPMMDMIERYVTECQPGPKTIKKWRPAPSSLIAHLGHHDAARVTPDDVAWRGRTRCCGLWRVKLCEVPRLCEGYLPGAPLLGPSGHAGGIAVCARRANSRTAA